VGAVVHATLATLGVSALLVSSETLYLVLRVAGALYLLWMGASILWATRPKKPAPAQQLVTVGGGGGPEPAPESAPEPDADEPNVGRRSFLMGIGSNLLNPKVILFYVAFVPQFVHPGEGAAARTAMLAATFIGLAVAWWIVYILTIDRLHDWLTRPRVQVWIERLTGVILVVLALRLAFS
jgi:threonine/homoserine/homoserine lactone efflux protein